MSTQENHNVEEEMAKQEETVTENAEQQAAAAGCGRNLFCPGGTGKICPGGKGSESFARRNTDSPVWSDPDYHVPGCADSGAGDPVCCHDLPAG